MFALKYKVFKSRHVKCSVGFNTKYKLILLNAEEKKTMKKLAIAASSVALAAMPVVGVFAADNISIDDNITITVSDNCAFTRETGTGTYTATMSPNALNANVGASTYKVICNNSKGYSVGAVFSGLTGDQTTPETITYSATTPTAGSGTWTATKTVAAGNIAASGGVLMSNNGTTPAAGDTETVTYQVSTTNTQAAGSYTGKATYTFLQAN